MIVKSMVWLEDRLLGRIGMRMKNVEDRVQHFGKCSLAIMWLYASSRCGEGHMISGFNKLLMRKKNYFFVECLLCNRSKLPPIQSAVSSLESRRASACFISQRLIWSRGCISSKDLGKYVLINAIPNDKLG